jgi:hypothetical protein
MGALVGKVGAALLWPVAYVWDALDRWGAGMDDWADIARDNEPTSPQQGRADR